MNIGFVTPPEPMNAQEVCEKLKLIGLHGDIQRTGHWDYVRVFILDRDGITQGRITIHKGEYSHSKWYVGKVSGGGRIFPDEYYPTAWHLLLEKGLLLPQSAWPSVVRDTIQKAEALRAEKQARRDANPKPNGKKRKPLPLNTRRFLYECAEEHVIQ